MVQEDLCLLLREKGTSVMAISNPLESTFQVSHPTTLPIWSTIEKGEADLVQMLKD